MEAFPELRRSFFLDSLSLFLRLPVRMLALDPEFRVGDLREFIRAATLSNGGELYKDREILEALTMVELRLDPEGDPAEQWAERLVISEAGAPKALLRQGVRELALGRPDRALPWLLWAAYTSEQNHPDSPRYWAQLSELYRHFDWRTPSREASEQAVDQSPWVRSRSLSRIETSIAKDCRIWHDWLMDYQPERLIRQRQSDWRTYVEDLEIWNQKCDFSEPDPFPLRLESCPQPPLRLPRLAFRQLRNRQQGFLQGGPVVFADHLVCAVEQAIVLPKRLDTFVRGFEETSLRHVPAYWNALALLELRHGQVSAALAAWQRGLSTESPLDSREEFVQRVLANKGNGNRFGMSKEALQGWRVRLASEANQRLREEFFLAAMRQLGSLPNHIIEPAGPMVLEFAQRWTATLLGEADSTLDLKTEVDILLRLARLELRLEPESPWGADRINRLVILTGGGERALLLRGGLELSLGRPDRSLPWFLWAQSRSRRQGTTRSLSEPAGEKLSSAYLALGWWPQPDSPLPSLEPNLAFELQPGDAFPRKLKDSCVSLLGRVADLNIDQLIRRNGDDWWERSPLLRDWSTQCQWKDPVPGIF